MSRIAKLVQSIRQRGLNRKLAVRVSGNTNSLRIDAGVAWTVGSGCVIETGDGVVSIGATWPGLPKLPSVLKIADCASIRFENAFSWYSGLFATVNEGAEFTVGGGYVNYRSTIECFRSITIGDKVAIGPDVMIRDSDNHIIGSAAEPATSPVHIGSRVWIGARATILKGVHLGDGCIVAAGAVVTKSFPEKTLIGGVQARVIRRGVDWK